MTQVEIGCGPVAGYENFAALISTVDQIEWLQLSEAGHQRAVFNWTAVKWTGLWLVP